MSGSNGQAFQQQKPTNAAEAAKAYAEAAAERANAEAEEAKKRFFKWASLAREAQAA